MILVALLTGSPDDTAAQARLAGALGVTAYEARLALAAGFPTILLTTGDHAKGTALAATLRAQGDDAVAFDAASVVSAGAMVPFDHFTFEPSGVVAGKETLPYDDVFCLLRGVHRAHVATETKTSERQFSAAKSLLSGGFSNTKVVSRSTSESTDSREAVLYVFRQSGSTPWILRETGTHYEGLGADRALTKVANFATTIRLLRENAPGAIYDDRLSKMHRALERAKKEGAGERATVTTSYASGVDALAHLVALALAPRASRYR